MEVLILNSSPRVQGNISQMLAAMREEFDNAGVSVKIIHTARCQVKPCSGCMICRKKGDCVYPEDDAQRILAAIRSCDCLIVGAPCYWGNMPGQLKLIFDRIVYGMMGENKWGMPLPLHKGKHAIIITASTTPFPFNILYGQTRGVIRSLKEILKWSGFRITDTIEVGGTHKRPVSEHTLKRCRKIARKLIKNYI